MREENKTDKLCPFRKLIMTKVEYNYSNYANARGKPGETIKTEEFKECDMNCMVYDGGICKMMEGNK